MVDDPVKLAVAPKEPVLKACRIVMTTGDSVAVVYDANRVDWRYDDNHIAFFPTFKKDLYDLFVAHYVCFEHMERADLDHLEERDEPIVLPRSGIEVVYEE